MAMINDISINEDMSIRKEEILSTPVSEKDLADAWTDEYGVKYSKDGKRLLKGNPYITSYVVRAGTEVICDLAFDGGMLRSVVFPEGLKFIGTWAFMYCEFISRLSLPTSLVTIADLAFYHCKSLYSVTLPEGLLSIGDNAFAGCESLKSVRLPGSLSVMGRNPFEGSGMREIISGSDKFRVEDGFLREGGRLVAYFGDKTCIDALPEGITYVGEGAFSSLGSLRSATLPEGVIRIGTSAFRDCGMLARVTLPEGVTFIGDRAFEGCGMLERITFTGKPDIIGKNALDGCDLSMGIVVPKGMGDFFKNLFGKDWDIKIEEESPASVLVVAPGLDDGGVDEYGVKYSLDGKRLLKGSNNVVSYAVRPGTEVIVDGAFRECESLMSVTCSEGLKVIGESAFCECRSLESVTLPEGVAFIGEDAFYECGSLKSVSIREGLESIGDWAFCGCLSLERIALPKSLSEIEGNPFAMSGIHDITSESEEIRAEDGFLYSGQKLIYYFGEREEIERFPKGIREIGTGAFQQNSHVKQVTIPDGVTEIGDYAFDGCRALENITLPEGLKIIYECAFEECESLRSITIPEGVVTIGPNAFDRCKSLKIVTIPKGVTEIASSAFDNCETLESIVVPAGMREYFEGILDEDLHSKIVEKSPNS